MQFGEALVFDVEFDATGRVDLDHIDEVPGDDARGKFGDEVLQRAFRHRAAEQAAQGSAQADLNLCDAKLLPISVGLPAQIDIVDTNDFATVDIDDLTIEQVLAQEDEVLVALNRIQCGIGAEFQCAAGGPANLTGGDNLKTLPGFQDQTCDATGLFARANGDIFEAAPHAAAHVGDGRAEKGGQRPQCDVVGHDRGSA